MELNNKALASALVAYEEAAHKDETTAGRVLALRAAILSYLAETAGWISVDERLPPDETPVIILLDGLPNIGELRWEHPSWEETYESFRYWDNPSDDGKDWCWSSITHWMPLPEPPK